MAMRGCLLTVWACRSAIRGCGGVWTFEMSVCAVHCMAPLRLLFAYVPARLRFSFLFTHLASVAYSWLLGAYSWYIPPHSYLLHPTIADLSFLHFLLLRAFLAVHAFCLAFLAALFVCAFGYMACTLTSVTTSACHVSLLFFSVSCSTA
jgi:hypothetical protein